MTKGAGCSAEFYSPLFFILALGAAFILRRRKRVRSIRSSAADDRSLWVGLAAGLFEASESPAESRLEIALAAIAKRVGMRAGMVSLVSDNGCRVLAVAGADNDLIAGLAAGTLLPRQSVYCGSIREPGQFLAINYASLSEWRRHPASRDRGWESYVGLSCGAQKDEGAIVISFFDSLPRERLIGQSERSLVEQVGPWIKALLEGESFPVSPGLDSFTLKESANELRG